MLMRRIDELQLNYPFGGVVDIRNQRQRVRLSNPQTCPNKLGRLYPSSMPLPAMFPYRITHSIY
jgi:hypothetical protein